MKSRLWILLIAIVLPLLHACGGNSNNNAAAHVRVINTTGTALDVSTNSSGSPAFVPTVPAGTTSAYVDLGAGTYPFYVLSAGTSVNSTTRTVAGGYAYSLVTYRTSGAVTTTLVTEAQPGPSSGNSAFRVFNTSNEAGSLDVYLTANNVDINAAGPNVLAVPIGRLSLYGEIAKGTYRLRVTGTGSKTDVRLDIPAITLADGQIATLILSSTSGGALVDGYIDNEGGTVTRFANTSARVRLLANATAGNSVSAAVNGVALSGGTGTAPNAVASPNVGNYALIPSGTLTTTVLVGGTAVTVPALTAAAGSDNTLIVAGTAAAPKLALLIDDNSPALDTTRAKLRLINAINGVAGNVTLTVDLGSTLDAAFGAASASSITVIGSSTSVVATHQLDVRSATGSLASVPNVNLTAGQVYTVFVLGDVGAVQTLVRSPL